MKSNQLAAIKALEAALLACKRANLAICGIDDSLIATVADKPFTDESMASSACQAMLLRANTGDSAISIKHHGAYRDSGGA